VSRPLCALAAILILSALAASTVSASLPGGNNDIAPQAISLVGSAAGVPGRDAGSFEVIARDLAGNPIAGSHVVIDLSGCPELRLCADQLDPAVDFDCVNKRVGKFTDSNGRATFVLLGSSTGAGTAVTRLAGGKIYENGMLIRTPTVSAFDLDGASGVGANDMSVFINDFMTGIEWGRSDYDGSGSLGANDLSLWITVFGSGAQAESCTAACP
jgi:hypothetical protein